MMAAPPADALEMQRDARTIRVLVAEDSLTARALLVAILRSDPALEIVGEASNGHEAVELTRRLRPDVITMDIRMPLMDGFEATRHIMVEAPTPIVIISAAYHERDVEVAMHALRLGALTVLPKPPAPGAADFDAASGHLVQTVKAMAAVKVVRRWRDRTVRPVAPAPSTTATRSARIVAMAASTGGPVALGRILSDLPAEFGLPVLVVQHIAHGFVDGLAAWLNTTSAIPVRVASAGDPLRPNTVYLAPDDHHLLVAGETTLALSRAPARGGFRPSASELFDSVARVFGEATLAVMLTGMGDDGVAGLRSVRAAGGRIIAQDADTSVVYGMPGAAVAAGLPDQTLPLDDIAPRLKELIDHGR